MKNRDKWVKQLCKHVYNESAVKAVIPVTLEGVEWRVTVECVSPPCTDERMCSGCFSGTGCKNPNGKG